MSEIGANFECAEARLTHHCGWEVQGTVGHSIDQGMGCDIVSWASQGPSNEQCRDNSVAR